ncbi:uncharacterized protein T551_03546 [Pneumocystis jirovecii RU7]|uniref:Uncharacterized protein n=1 Tax=Pneumocystis jirovecii (strain RU7) TaxID=1408657 RepID=A0A0W4ZD67_PNEJ7|nr:uncharacterized protein T551_03546 [Pneumocystis jirovecii RU7]KTW26247.1 hypothetical protein T551_03546 [Pneumocystis jirovecii RU7]
MVLLLKEHHALARTQNEGSKTKEKCKKGTIFVHIWGIRTGCLWGKRLSVFFENCEMGTIKRWKRRGMREYFCNIGKRIFGQAAASFMHDGSINSS